MGFTLISSRYQRNVVSWNKMLAAYIQQGLEEAAWQLYERMQEEGVIPDLRTFVSAVQLCGMLAKKEEDSFVNGLFIKMNSLGKGKAIHAEAWRKGYESDIFIGCTLITMYGRCGGTSDAVSVFDGLFQQNVVSYNAMLAAYMQHDQPEKALHLYLQMREDRLSPNERTFVSVLQACGMIAEDTDVPCRKMECLENGKAINADAWRRGFHPNLFIGSTLISMYGKCASLVDAQNVFDGLCQRDAVLWNALLVAYVEHGKGEKTLHLYENMHEEGIIPNHRTLVSTIQACSIIAEKEEEVLISGQCTRVKSLKLGKTVHADAHRRGYILDVFVGNALIHMYGKCGSIVDAESVFGSLPEQDLVSWNAMLAVYAQDDHAHKALELYDQMQEGSVTPDNRTLLSALLACGLLAKKEEDVIVGGQLTKLKSLQRGKTIHAYALARGYGLDLFIGSTLVTVYEKCGSILDAQKVFDGLQQRSVVTWNAIIAAYVEQGQGERALDLYRQMQAEGMRPDEVTFICILQACSNTGNLDFCRHIYQVALTSNKLSNLLASTLIHAYGRCSSMLDAQIVFDALPQPDVVVWTGLIAGYARQGNSALSLQCYDDMRLAGTKPDRVTFLSVLSACSHAGLVEEGVKLFESMSKDYGLTPGIEHYVTMVDLLGRAGYFDRVEHLVATMPLQPNLALWLCLLGACRSHGNVVLGKRAFDCAVSLKPQYPAAYDLMSNIFADAGLWEQEKMVNVLRETASAWKKPGQTWIQHEREVHTFLVGDHMHTQQERVYALLQKVS